ncbi:hypothetical protein [Chitinophaga sp. XS-30]|nr:hypothetical protein [Chitinophaga sp. XS-30]
MPREIYVKPASATISMQAEKQEDPYLSKVIKPVPADVIGV